MCFDKLQFQLPPDDADRDDAYNALFVWASDGRVVGVVAHAGEGAVCLVCVWRTTPTLRLTWMMVHRHWAFRDLRRGANLVPGRER